MSGPRIIPRKATPVAIVHRATGVYTIDFRHALTRLKAWCWFTKRNMVLGMFHL